MTAGVQTNATCAGDPASWRETPEGIAKVAAVAGTINTMLLLNRPMTAAALARTVVTMTEGKSAALQRLAVPELLLGGSCDRHRHRSVLRGGAAARRAGR